MKPDQRLLSGELNDNGVNLRHVKNSAAGVADSQRVKRVNRAFEVFNRALKRFTLIADRQGHPIARISFRDLHGDGNTELHLSYRKTKL